MSGSSAFNQLVEHFAAESATPETTPAPAATAQTVKPSTSSDPIPELPAAVRLAPARFTDTSILTAAPVGGRRADTRGAATSNAGNAQPPLAGIVDLNIPIPIPVAPKLQVPAGSPEPKPATTAVSNTEEPAAITLEPKPILEVKIHLNQLVTETPSVQQPTVAAAQSTVASVALAGQQNPQRGEADPGDADAGPAAEVIGHAVPRIAINQNAVAVVQQQKPDAGSTPPAAHESAAAPVGALPAPPAPVPQTARIATPEPATGSAAPPEESPLNQTKTQQPLRSLALEFAPDGAGDIKVRLSERAGDVHISLHGTDPSLAGRVREGVGELVGSLSKAGYDAEAWTPSEGRQNQRQQPDQRPPARDTGEADAEAFSGIFQQPIQEIS